MEEEFPILRYHFEVEIDGNTISFQDVTGLEAEVQTVEYRNGDSDNFSAVHIPGIVKYPILVCKKGIVEDDDELVDFLNAILEEKEYDQEDKMDISIRLLDPAGETVMNYELEGCILVKYSTPGFNALANEVALEEVSFRYDRMTVTTD